jgi:hypothetical protein
VSAGVVLLPCWHIRACAHGPRWSLVACGSNYPMRGGKYSLFEGVR